MKKGELYFSKSTPLVVTCVKIINDRLFNGKVMRSDGEVRIGSTIERLKIDMFFTNK